MSIWSLHSYLVDFCGASSSRYLYCSCSEHWLCSPAVVQPLPQLHPSTVFGLHLTHWDGKCDKKPFECIHACNSTNHPPLANLKICSTIQDNKGTVGGSINFILHTNHAFIWLHLFDNAPIVAFIEIFRAEYNTSWPQIIKTKYGIGIKSSYSLHKCTEMCI